MSKNIKLDEEKVLEDIINISLSMDNNNKLSLPMSRILYTLFRDYLTYDLERPFWANRDRLLISSKLSSLYYSLLFFMTNDYSINDIKNYGLLGSTTPCDLMYNVSSRIEISSGKSIPWVDSSLGFAMAEKHLEERYNKEDITLFEYYTYLVCTKEELLSSFETLLFANEYGLDNLIIMCAYLNDDDNNDKGKILDTFLAVDYEIIEIKDYDNPKEIEKALANASRKSKPVLILLNIDNNIENPEIKPYYYDIENTKLLKKEIEIRLKEEYRNWYEDYKKYMSSSSEKDKEELISLLNEEITPLRLDKIIDLEKLNLDKSLAYTNYQIINVMSTFLPSFLGLTSTNNQLSILKGKKQFSKDNYLGKNISLYNKECCTGNIANGFALTGYKPYVYGNLIDVTKMLPQIRSSAIMNIPVTYIFTNDTFINNSSYGSDIPLEQINILRSIPNLEVYRPCDYKELLGVWNEILKENRPSVIILSNNKLESFKYTSVSETEYGGYVISEVKNRLDIIIMASGSEVELAMKLKQELLKNYIEARIVSVPNLKRFINSDIDYLAQVLPKGYKKMAIEFSNDSLWYGLVNNPNDVIEVKEYGKSSSTDELKEYYNLDMSSIIIKIKNSL